MTERLTRAEIDRRAHELDMERRNIASQRSVNRSSFKRDLELDQRESESIDRAFAKATPQDKQRVSDRYHQVKREADAAIAANMARTPITPPRSRLLRGLAPDPRGLERFGPEPGVSGHSPYPGHGSGRGQRRIYEPGDILAPAGAEHWSDGTHGPTDRGVRKPRQSH